MERKDEDAAQADLEAAAFKEKEAAMQDASQKQAAITQPNDAETKADHDQPKTASEHEPPVVEQTITYNNGGVAGDPQPETDGPRSAGGIEVTPGFPVQFFTDEAPFQAERIGAGPYAAVVTEVIPDTDGGVSLKVFPPFRAPFDVANVMFGEEKKDGDGRYWQFIHS